MPTLWLFLANTLVFLADQFRLADQSITACGLEIDPHLMTRRPQIRIGTQRRGQKLPSYPRLEQRQYDLVLLDPPAWAKSAFGTVDLLRDYQSLLKPALLATADNGVLICCNNLAKVSMDDWREQVLRCAEKAGRPVRDWKIMTPGADFPSQDQQPPLKTLILQL